MGSVVGYILVIHDNEEDLENIRLFLTLSGYNIEASSSWEQARRLFDRDPSCDLVIAKMKMKETNGNDIANYIRNSQKTQIPILAIGGTGNNIDRNLFNSVLMTPVKLKFLGETVASFLPPTIMPG